MNYYSAQKYIVMIITFLLLGNIVQSQDSTHLRISLIKKRLEKIPDSIFHKTNLRCLDLGVGWMQLPPDGSKPTIMNANHIEIVPNEISKLQLLEELDLSFNDIRTLPSNFSELKNLKTLILLYNENFDILKNIPVLKGLKNLTQLNLIGISQVSFNKERTRKDLGHIPKLWLEWKDVPVIRAHEFKYKDSL